MSLPLPKKITLSLAVLFSASAPALAGDINWSCASNSENYTSAGAPNALGEGFVFEVGAFSDSFVPTAANTSQWAEKWVALDRAIYNPFTKFFTSKAAQTSNADPFGFGKPGYIWGFDQAAPGEWILMKNPTWYWTGAGGGPAPPAIWSVSHPDTVAVVGEVNGSGFQMLTEQVDEEPPDVSPAAWQQQFFNAAERNNLTISGWDADPDFDGSNNLIELAAGTDPKSSNSRPTPSIELVDTGGGDSALVLTLPRAHRAAVDYGAETSIDLSGWSGSGIEVVSDELKQIVLRCPTAAPGRLFIRLLISLGS